LRLVRPKGRLALLIGTAQIDQARSLLPSFRWQGPQIIPLSQSRVLLSGLASEAPQL
jgi:hypothetical protein